MGSFALTICSSVSGIVKEIGRQLQEKTHIRTDQPSRLPDVGEIEDTVEVKVKVREPEASPLLGTRTLTDWGPLGPTDIVHSSDVEECKVTAQSAPPTVTSLLERSNPVPLIVMAVPCPPGDRYVDFTLHDVVMFMPHCYRCVHSILIHLCVFNTGIPYLYCTLIKVWAFHIGISIPNRYNHFQSK